MATASYTTTWNITDYRMGLPIESRFIGRRRIVQMRSLV